MSPRAELTVPVKVDAPADVVWATITDWVGQGEWMLGTRIRVTSPGDGRYPGARFTAFTGVGPIGFSDPIEVVQWDPPRRCVVAHLGRVVRGDGEFEVIALGPDRALFLWTERLDLPLGVLGRVGWPLVRPVLRLGVAHSLRSMARLAAARHRSGQRAG